MAGRIVSRRQMFLQPKKLRNLHFGRDGATDVTKNVVMRVVDKAGFGRGAMVHPDDHIAPFVARHADRQRIGTSVEYHEGASRIKTHTLDGRWRKRGLRHGGA